MSRSERVLRILERLHADRFAQPWLSGRGVILCLHRVAGSGTPALDPDLAIPVEVLDEAIRVARAQGYVAIPMDEIPDWLRRRRKQRFVAFTFDDGYRDNVAVALPVFQAHRVPLCIYVSPGLIDRSAEYWWGALGDAVTACIAVDLRPAGFPHLLDTSTWRAKQIAFERVLSWVHTDLERLSDRVAGCCRSAGFDGGAACDRDILTWDEVRTVAQDPLVTIGAHGIGHVRLARLSYESARFELTGAKDRIEREIGRPVRHVAYPYGGPSACGPREFTLARDAGYLTAVTSRRGALFSAHASRLTALPRQRLDSTATHRRVHRRSILGTDWLLRRGPIVARD